MTQIRAILVTPLSGPLSLFGKTSARALSIWARRAANLPAPWTGVDLEVRDTGDNPEAAIQAAVDQRPDVLFGPYGHGPMLRVARVCEHMIWNHGGASSRLARPTFPQVVNVLSPASTYFTGVLQAIQHADPTVKTVSLFHSTTGFACEVATGATATATVLGLAVQAVPFEASSALTTASTVPEGDILLVVGNFADELAVAPLLVPRAFRFAAFVGAGVEEVLAPLGSQREGLLGPAQWVKTAAIVPDEGPDSAWFVTAYRGEEGSDPPYAAAQAFAAGLLYARCLRETKEVQGAAILAAAQKLVCRTLYGAFQLDPASGLQTGHQVLIVQWQEGQQRIVWPPEYAEAPLSISPTS